MDYIDLAKKYHPKKIKVLFIGESPPNRALMIDGICKPSYFYAEYDNSYSLASILNCDIFGKEHQKGEWKKEFLENFFKERLYLIDLYPHEPIDKSKPDSEISAKLDKGKETIVQRVENENPEAIVILMESLYKLIKPLIQNSVRPIVPVKFPLYYSKGQEREKRRKILSDFGVKIK